MAVALDGEAANFLAGERLVCASEVDDEGIVAYGLKLALDGFAVGQRDFDGLSRCDALEARPICFVSGAKRWSDCGGEEQQQWHSNCAAQMIHGGLLGWRFPTKLRAETDPGKRQGTTWFP